MCGLRSQCLWRVRSALCVVCVCVFVCNLFSWAVELCQPVNRSRTGVTLIMLALFECVRVSCLAKLIRNMQTITHTHNHKLRIGNVPVPRINHGPTHKQALDVCVKRRRYIRTRLLCIHNIHTCIMHVTTHTRKCTPTFQHVVVVCKYQTLAIKRASHRR